MSDEQNFRFLFSAAYHYPLRLPFQNSYIHNILL
jgi:hypothetical protein